MTFGICTQIDLLAFDLMVSNYPDLKAVCPEKTVFMDEPFCIKQMTSKTMLWVV